MENGRGKVECEVCKKTYVKFWQHLSKQYADTPHRELKERLQLLFLREFHSDKTAVDIGSPYGVSPSVISILWIKRYGRPAATKRKNRIKTRKKPPCEECGNPLGKWGVRFCSPRCANSFSMRSQQVRAKIRKKITGIPKSTEHKAAISKALCNLRDLGILPAMQPEVRAKVSATKKQQGVPKDALRGFMDKTTPAQRRENGTNLYLSVRRLYGVRHSYDIPGIREKANQKKSEAMAARIAAGIPTNDWGRYKRGWHDSPIAGAQWYASGWELVRMQTLDTQGVVWTKKHGIRIRYEDFEGESRYYVPDFLITMPDGSCILEEVKGYAGKNVPLKTIAAQNFCEEKGWLYRYLDSLQAIQEAYPVLGK